MEQDEVALIKAIQSGETELSALCSQNYLQSSDHRVATSSQEITVGTILSSD